MTKMTQDELNVIKQRVDTIYVGESVGRMGLDLMALVISEQARIDHIAELETQIVFDKEVKPDLDRKKITELEAHNARLVEKLVEAYRKIDILKNGIGWE